MAILVTGGAGYIGSHAVQRLLRDGHEVVAVDNEFRGHVRPVELLAHAHPKMLTYLRADINEVAPLKAAIDAHKVHTVMHFAAHAYVGESVEHPLTYYHNNVSGLVNVLRACDTAVTPVSKFVFSSSCSTYGQPPANMIPVQEECPQNPVSPYGHTKLMGEQILRDFAESRRIAAKPFACTSLRYFNVCGCDRSGMLGEHHEPETHLVPVVLQAALGKRPHIGLFGTDYPTRDGTCVRDYVHVEDLVAAHVLAMAAVQPGETKAYNVGIGKGYSVREIIATASKVSGREIAVNEQPRRPGDPPEVYNDPARIVRELGWKPEVPELEAMIESAWRWFEKNPDGYPKS